MATEENTLIDRFILLPSELQQLIVSKDFRDSIRGIGIKNGLQGDQLSFLENEVLFVLLNLEDVGDLPQNIQDNVKIFKERAITIADELEDEVFIPITGFLGQLEEGLDEALEKLEKEGEGTSPKTIESFDQPQRKSFVPPPPPPSKKHVESKQTTAASTSVPTNLPGVDSKRIFSEPKKSLIESNLNERKTIQHDHINVIDENIKNTPIQSLQSKKEELTPSKNPPKRAEPDQEDSSIDPYREPAI